MSPNRRRSRRPGSQFLGPRARVALPIVAVVTVGVAILAALAVLPARTWVSQRDNLAEVEAELDQVEAEVADLQAELDQLQTDEEIERLARENFDLVRPGEESYRIVPEDDTTP